MGVQLNGRVRYRR